MGRTLKDSCYLKRLENPFIYDAAADELYELDEEAFARIRALADEGQRDKAAADLLAAAGLAAEGPRAQPAWIEGASASPSLRYLELQITGRCDKGCSHCYLGKPQPVDITAGGLSALLEQFAVMQGLKVLVSGGEPRCHPRFRELAAALVGRPFRRVLVTHGEGIDSREAALLAGLFDQVQLSVDGVEEGHDQLRGTGSFVRMRAGLDALRQANVPVAAATMVHRHNLGQFDAMARFMEDNGVEEWAIDVPCSAGRWRDREPAGEELLREMSQRLRYAYGGGYHGGSGGLACGSHLMTVFPDGTAAKCGFYPPLPGADAFADLAGAWARVEHLNQEQLECDCDYLELCAGGCRYRAEILEGSSLAIDPVQCYARGVK